MTKEEYIQMAANIKAAMADPEGGNIGGMYLEGPYINPAYGSNRAANPWNNKPIIPEDYEPIIAACAELAMVWGLGPEQENVESFVKAAHAANPNTRFAVTHSEATPQQIEKLMPYGLCIGTHHTNATGTIVNYPECRGVCVDEAVNYNREIYAELICDSCGIHVDPYMLRLVRKIKGDDRIILISDRSYADAPNPPGYEHVTDINFDKWGDIAGSKLTLEVACRNWMKHTGASIVDAFRVASYNPARAVGFTDRGEIREGLRADLIFVDEKMHVSKVILAGEVKS
jgi:N-acetylglucosamine-6-phosphate deacetylase